MKMLAGCVVALGITLAASGCGRGAGSEGTDNPAQATASADGKEFSIRVGESVRIEGTQSNLSFLAVPEDSRCPSGVQCIWAGNARVSLKLDATQFDLNTTVEPHEAVVQGYRFQLVQVSTRPEGDTVTGNYTATLKVIR
jgi:hypothetical protein